MPDLTNIFVGGASGQLGKVNPTTLVHTLIATYPQDGRRRTICSIFPISDEDIWCGLDTGDFGGGARVIRWYNNQWTTHEFQTTNNARRVNALVVYEGNVYCTANTGQDGRYQLWKYNGSVWAVVSTGVSWNAIGWGGKLVGCTYGGQPILGSASSPYVEGCGEAAPAPTFLYDGSFHAYYPGWPDSRIVGIGRLSNNKLLVCSLDGKIFQSDGMGQTWAQVGSAVVGSFSAIMWINRDDDTAWILGLEYGVWRIQKYINGVTSLVQNGVTEIVPGRGFGGLSDGSGNTNLFGCYGSGSTYYIKRRNGATGTWDSSANIGYEVYTIDAYPGPPDVDPPYLANQNPEPDSENVSIDTIISTDILDDKSGVNANETEIYINDNLVWFEDAAVDDNWLIVKSVIDSGYHYSIQSLPGLVYNTFYSLQFIGEDIDGNAFDETFSFLTEDWPSPIGSGFVIDTSEVSTVEVEEEDYQTEIHPITKRFIIGFGWDETFWPDDRTYPMTLKHKTALPAIYDANFSGIPLDYWQAGIGGGEDLELNDLTPIYTSGIFDNANPVHTWMPTIKHGHFFLGTERSYLHGDDSIVHILQRDEIVSGVEGSPNLLRLDTKPFLGAPIVARQYRWDSEEQKYKTQIEVRQKAYFTGLRDSNNQRLDTFDSNRNAILFSNIDAEKDEFITYFSGIPKEEFLVFNKQFSTQIGTYSLSSGEFLGYVTGENDETFHTKFSPIDPSQPLVVNTYLGMSGIYQSWEVVPDLNTVLSGQQVGIDLDLGLVRFPGEAGIKPIAGYSVEANYYRTVKVEYEPENSDNLVTCPFANANPIQRYTDGGFLFLTDENYEPAGVILATEDIQEISSWYFGPLYIGNNIAKLVATVVDRKGLPLEGVSVRIFMTTVPPVGSIGNSDNEVYANTDWEGKARSYYKSPSSIDEIGEYITTSGIVNGSPDYDGVSETKTFTTTELSLSADVDDVFLFQVWANDPILGYKSVDAEDTLAAQLNKYYRDFFLEEGIYGPTGLHVGGEPNEDAADWESNHRQIWNLLRPIIFTGSQGKKILVVSEDLDSLDPHEFNSPAIAPYQPIDIIQASQTEHNLVFDTSSFTLPDPSDDTFPAYFVIAPTVVEFQASVYIQSQKKYLYSNKVKLKLDIPPHLNGTWLIDDLNEVDLSEISEILASKDPETILNKKVVFGFRLKSDSITLAGALGGITFLDVNSHLSPSKWPSVGYKATLSNS